MNCETSRPCSRCIRRGIQHLCRDVVTKKRARSVDSRQDHETAVKQENEMVLGSPPWQLTDYPLDSPVLPSIDACTSASDDRDINLNDWSGLGDQSVLGQIASLNKEMLFISEQAGSEFSSLNDFLTMTRSPCLETSNNSTTSISEISEPHHPETEIKFSDLSPSCEKLDRDTPQNLKTESSSTTELIKQEARDKFFLTAADPTLDKSPEERLEQVIKAKVEAGLLKPFNYVRGYTRLQKYVDSHMRDPYKRHRILRALSVFRPAFRAVAQSLMDLDLVLVEEAFERSLLKYDRVFTSMATPACLWRRTGEVYRGNKEFGALVEASVDELRDGKLAVYEIMSEDSAVHYWEKYGDIAFDAGQKAVLTTCNLVTRKTNLLRKCCFSFTITRDKYNIPSCIVGNFIPLDF